MRFSVQILLNLPLNRFVHYFIQSEIIRTYVGDTSGFVSARGLSATEAFSFSLFFVRLNVVFQKSKALTKYFHVAQDKIEMFLVRTYLLKTKIRTKNNGNFVLVLNVKVGKVPMTHEMLK